MTSSMITGERRWASARRGGMTVLGKVAVPKPINLPSQKLENHGMDPNVEIVPKGTLSWGSRPSSAGSNAWGASSLSPRTDGSSSPKHLAGRPSSGGGTRPSTAGSEKASESNVGAWGSNSRPSSASGVVASSNSSLTSLRPRSAETRPGSSQLSRFAEPSAESSVSRISNATSERMGAGSAGNDGFSLSSGDFPTLGSEKDESRKNMEPLDCAPHGRPGSSSGRLTTTGDNVGIAHGDEMSRNADFKGNSWRNDGPTYVDDGPRPGMERWHGEPPPYPNHNMGPPHYESWRGGPPVNSPGGVWYRGPAGPPPYGAPPGGFPMEPFPYYRPQVPPHGVANSQPIPPGAGPHGPHPKNGDMYRGPPMPDSYMRPGMPMRPGFYPGPVPYEGYYGPPMGFCNPNERDMPPFMGMAPPGPPIYNRPPVNQNGPDPNNSRPRSREHRGPEQVEHVRNDPRGNYKVLTKQNDNSWHQNEEERWNHNRMIVNAPNREKGILSRSSVQESAWADDPKDMHYGKSVVPAEEVPSQTFEKILGSNDNAKRLPVSSVNETDRSCVTENAAASPRDHSLIQKIEGLNAKARATGGGRQNGSHREQQPLEKVHIVNAKGNRPAIDATSDVNPGRHHRTGVIPGSPDINIATVEKSHESGASSVTTATSRAARGALNRGDHQGRGRLNGQEADGRMKKAEAHSVVSAAVSESTNDEVKQNHPVVQPGEGPKPDVERRGSAVSTFDQSDTQRAKMREIAKQRAIQLQKEEEERTREQKAKALAKLEELNRRSANQGVENQSQSSESVPSQGGAPNKPEDSSSKKQPEPNLDAGQSTESSSVSSNSGQTNERSSSGVLDSHVGGVTKKSVDKDPVISQSQSEASDAKLNLSQVREAPKQQKRVAHKQRQNAPSQKPNMQETTPSVRADVLKDQGTIAPPEEASGNLAAGREVMDSIPLVSDSQVHHKKKNNKSGKNKHKMEEPSNATATVSSSEAGLQKDSRVAHDSPDDLGKVASDLNNVNPSSTHSSTDAKDQPLENHSSLSREDVHGRQNNSWKGQHSRKSRGPQNNRVPEKSHGNDAAVVWAPVRSNNNKADVTEQTGEKLADLSVPSEVGSSAVPRNNSKTKRAEMERYVPKPVAKELAQQGSTQHSSSPPPSTEPEGSGTDNVTKAGPVAETKHVDGRHHHNKQHKVQHGAWRQRVPAQSSSQDSSSSTANTSNSNVQPSEKSHQSVRTEETRVGGTHSGGPDVSFCDGWDDPGDPNFTSSAPVFEMKVHTSSQGKGKRNPSSKGGHKTSGYNQNFDRKDPNPALTDSQYPPVDTNQAPSRENRAGGDRSTTSQWQPKSQGLQGNRRQGDQDVNPNNVESYSEDKHGDRGMPNLGNEESKRDNNSNSNNNNKRGNSSSFRGHSNQGPMIEAESGSSGGASDGLNEQRPTSGYRKNANYGGRPNRDWSSTSQENKQHYSSGNRDRQRQNSHYEYQPVGPHNNNNNTRRPSNDHPGAQKDNQAGGQKFRERGNNYSRRGGGRGNNYYGRQSGGNPSDAGGY